VPSGRNAASPLVPLAARKAWITCHTLSEWKVSHETDNELTAIPTLYVVKGNVFEELTCALRLCIAETFLVVYLAKKLLR